MKRILKTYRYQISLFAISLFVIFSFQDCGKFETLPGQVAQLSQNNILFQFNEDPNCETTSSYSACAFDKSPSLSTITLSQIPLDIGLHFTDVNITKSSITAGNSFITDTTKQVGIVSSNVLRQPATSDNPYMLHKISALYWENKTQELLGQSGNASFTNQKINFVVDAPATGFSFSKSAIYLGKRSDSKSLALDGGVVVHLLGEAYAAYATNGQLINLSSDNGQHVNCRYLNKTLLDRECCSSSLGCSKAITAGLSDYLVSQVFPTSTQLGEYAAQNALGAQVCGLYRNPSANATLTAAQAYAGCASVGQSGQTYAMGVLFSSIWYEVSLSAKANHQDVNKIYIALLSRLEAQDTFLTVLTKIQQIDTSGQIYNLFKNEYIKRGFQI